MSGDSTYEKEIRKRITRRYENRTQFFGNLVSFMIFNAILWSVFQPQAFWAVVAAIITGGWFLGLSIHLVNFWMTEARERAIEKAIEREREWRGGYIPEGELKLKRERLIEISDDGELVEVIEDEYPQASRKRKS